MKRIERICTDRKMVWGFIRTDPLEQSNPRSNALIYNHPLPQVVL